MQARNAAGRQVSLLNDDSSSFSTSRPNSYHQQRPVSFHSVSHGLSRPYPSPRSNSSSPNTPELLRSDSYDSQMSNDPISPLTPSVDYTYPRGSLYLPMDAPPAKRPAYTASSRATSFDDDSSAQSGMADQRPSKRYPCRYRDSHGCEKTFTTSGHASRHSKIHTAEKAVQCTFHGCQKKFTRADNMKQHLETHYKDKSRSSGVARVHKAALAEARRSTSGSSRSRPTVSTCIGARDATRWEGEQHHRPMPSPPLPSPTNSAAWDMRSMNLPLLSRPVAARTPSTGLDALAMAVACQEGGS
ncbi:zinc finger domain-containing protein [Hirsutella rhossiliensis]|uniref:C2H2 type master regulator of conidiophore development brlA n=1 Tax=Hirsutella rhossiliensis TaxID=111463 RepID=A0A9P8MMW0_9HYPO|nr:zinc finger domain-containing protein [Hirsutella rhossiliensis]KAH0957314.1 zinc finger domain-containing protein [Hirsutella rhossiliensis]